MYLDLATSYVCLQSAVGCRQPRKFIASNQWHDDPTPSIHTSRSTRTHFFFLCFAKLFIIINSLWARFNLNRRVGTQLKTYKNSSFGRKNEFCWLKPRSYVPNDTSRTKSRNDLAYSQIRFISLDHCGCSTLPSRTCRQLYIEQKCATYAIQWGGGKNRYLKINMFCLHISLFQSKPTQIFERIIFVFFSFASIWSYHHKNNVGRCSMLDIFIYIYKWICDCSRYLRPNAMHTCVVRAIDRWNWSVRDVIRCHANKRNNLIIRWQ